MSESKPLEGVRIVEAGVYMALPICNRILCEFGAEVIKVESSKAFDVCYSIPGYAPSVGQTEYQGAKRRMLLDFRHPKARSIFEKLLRVSDVFATNYRRDVLQGWGVDFPEVSRINPEIIILWQTGMGGTGPYTDYKVFGNIAQHTTGVSLMTGFSGVPNIINTSYSDYHASVFQVIGIIASLMRRRQTKRGSLVESSILKSGTCTIGPAILDYQSSGRVPEPMGNKDPVAAPHGIYPCKGDDRWCAIAVFTDGEWQAFCEVLGNPAWARQARFATFTGRLRNVDELDGLVGKWTASYTAAEVMEKMQKAGVPAGVVAKGEDLAQSEHLRERGFYQETTYYVPDLKKPGVEWKESAPIISSPVPVKFSDTPLNLGHIRRIGQDNDYVLREVLGMSRSEVEELTGQGVFV